MLLAVHLDDEAPPGLAAGLPGGGRRLAAEAVGGLGLELAHRGGPRALEPGGLVVGGHHGQQGAGLGPLQLAGGEGGVQGGKLGEAPAEVEQVSGLAAGQLVLGFGVVGDGREAEGADLAAVVELGQEPSEGVHGRAVGADGGGDLAVELGGGQGCSRQGWILLFKLTTSYLVGFDVL